jgi:hypothetical protein
MDEDFFSPTPYLRRQSPQIVVIPYGRVLVVRCIVAGKGPHLLVPGFYQEDLSPSRTLIRVISIDTIERRDERIEISGILKEKGYTEEIKFWGASKFY